MFYQKLVIPSVSLTVLGGFILYLNQNSEMLFSSVTLVYFFAIPFFQYIIYEVRNRNEYYYYHNLGLNKAVETFCSAQNASVVYSHKLFKGKSKSKIKELSGGCKRLLEIFMITMSDAKFVLIDEPFSGIAPVYIEEIKELIKAQSKNKGLIITDHDPMSFS